MITCSKCGHVYNNADTDYLKSGYHFSSASFPKGSYTTAAAIESAGEVMLSCPRDPGPAPTDSRDNDVYPAGSTPSGGSMYTGDDRYTAGDETDTTEPDESADVTHQP